MLRTFTNASIEYFIDRERRLVFGRWEGDLRGDELLAALPPLWRDYPEIGQWNAIHDMRDFTGFLEHRYTHEMMRLRAELVPGFDPQVRTAIVTADAMKTLELKVTQAAAPDRRFGLFPDNVEALEWITADQPERGRNAPLPWWFDRQVAANPVRIS